MRDLVVIVLDLGMVAYVLFRMLTTFVFLPLAGGFFYGHIGMYFVLVLFVATAALVCGFMRKRAISAILATIVALAAFCYWWASFRILGWTGVQEFAWFVMPELVFAACGSTLWLIQRSGPDEEQRDSSQ